MKKLILSILLASLTAGKLSAALFLSVTNDTSLINGPLSSDFEVHAYGNQLEFSAIDVGGNVVFDSFDYLTGNEVGTVARITSVRNKVININLTDNFVSQYQLRGYDLGITNLTISALGTVLGIITDQQFLSGLQNGSNAYVNTTASGFGFGQGA